MDLINSKNLKKMATPICKKYFELTPIERSSYVGQLLHSVMSDDDLYSIGKDLIDIAIAKGLFRNTVINPKIEDKEES
mgnify:CR=1 FL=1